MRKMLRYGFVAILLCFFYVTVRIAWNTQYIQSFQSSLLKWQVSSKSHHIPEDYFLLEKELQSRFEVYEEWVLLTHLDEGLVVNRYGDRFIDHCDSLLFSAIRYVALEKMKHSHAEGAWSAIRKSYDDFGRWVRHPKCSEKPLSRDMLIGVLLAFLYRPEEEARFLLTRLMKSIEEKSGYVAKGPFYVSFVTPGLLELMRRMALLFRLDPAEIPVRFQYGFSTLEWSTLSRPKGYRTHLIALQIWMEIFLRDEVVYPLAGKHRSFLSDVGHFVGPQNNFVSQRLIWSSQELLAHNSQNLFFRWLYLKANHATSPGVRFQILKRLSMMSAFPRLRLPNQCDRKADYLWQRDVEEYEPGTDCALQWSGVDFLWIVSLLMLR